jgi:hypothetical protein
MLVGDQRDRLINLAKKIKTKSFSEEALGDSVFELAYILERIEQLAPDLEIDTSSAGQGELDRFSKSSKAVRFYSQCLLLWSYRILDILEAMTNIETFPALKVARNILAAHYGTASGNLKSKLTREQGFVVSPTFSPGGNFKYVIGPLGSPASTASPSESRLVEQLFKEYCPEEQSFNWWYACYKILHQRNYKVSKQDLKKIERFIRNNGGVITDSQSTIEYVISSIEKY